MVSPLFDISVGCKVFIAVKLISGRPF